MKPFDYRLEEMALRYGGCWLVEALWNGDFFGGENGKGSCIATSPDVDSRAWFGGQVAVWHHCSVIHQKAQLFLGPQVYHSKSNPARKCNFYEYWTNKKLECSFLSLFSSFFCCHSEFGCTREYSIWISNPPYYYWTIILLFFLMPIGLVWIFI